MVVKVGHAVHGVDHKQYHVGFFYGEVYLLVDFALEDILGVDNPSSGIND